MKRRVVRFRAAFWIVSILSLNSGNTALGAKAQKRVLTIYSERNNLTGNAVVDETLRSVLTTQFNVPIDFRSEYINNASPLSERAYPALRDFLRAKYAGERLNVIIAVGEDAIRFVQRHGQSLFPGVPIVSWGSRDLIEHWGTGPPATGVLEPQWATHSKGGMDFILRMQPDARQVFVVSGASKFDRLRDFTARQSLRQYENRIKLTYLSGLPLDDLQRRLSHLPNGAAVFFLSMNEDGDGRKLLTRDVLTRITKTTNAPVYALSTVQLGSGVVGGLLINQENMTRIAAEMALRILNGEDVQDIPPQESVAVPMVDWRQLQRWNINEGRLPQGTAILFKEPSFWQTYRWHIIGVMSICVLEGMLILTLLIQQTKLKRAEREAARSHDVLQSTIDALDAHVALLDEDANIIAVNESWRRFAKINGYSAHDYGIGRNYLKICESSGACQEALMVQEGLQSLMTGESLGFSCVYDCSYGAAECWFQLKATRFLSQGVLRLALAHENITEIKQAHDIQQQYTGLLLQTQDEERRRIARDLHDVTVQNVATIKVELTRALRTSPSLEAHVQEAFGQSVSVCDQVIKELRTLSYLLHPPLLDEAGLVAALQWYVSGFIQRSGINVEILVIDNIGRLPTDAETTLFRVVQESLTNIHRHSGSRSAVIWVTKSENEVVVRIQDDGHGMSEKTSSPKNGQTLGVGILGMRERLRQLGGRLEIESDWHGTTITARTPVPQEGYVAYSCS